MRGSHLDYLRLVRTKEPSERRIGNVKERHVKDEFQLATLSMHKVWLPQRWPSGLGRPKYSLMAIEDRTWWGRPGSEPPVGER